MIYQIYHILVVQEFRNQSTQPNQTQLYRKYNDTITWNLLDVMLYINLPRRRPCFPNDWDDPTIQMRTRNISTELEDYQTISILVMYQLSMNNFGSFTLMDKHCNCITKCLKSESMSSIPKSMPYTYPQFNFPTIDAGIFPVVVGIPHLILYHRALSATL